MSIAQLKIHHVRSIRQGTFDLHPHINIFHGPNGSGKTSILESIYLLGTGHSFKTRETVPLITYDEPQLAVFAKMGDAQTISVLKSTHDLPTLKINHLHCSRTSDLARFLPCLSFYQDLFMIMDAGPSVRRALIDWGMFHVEHSYHELWKKYRFVLKQRNALLKQNSKKSHFVPWNNMLVELAEEITMQRTAHFDRWNDAFQAVLSALTDVHCSLAFNKGWDRQNTGKSLYDCLEEQFERDKQLQYTQSGAHQADIMFTGVKIKARQRYSRGQQKMILIALKFAQAKLLNQPCVYLLDDIISELDQAHIQRLIEYTKNISGQFVFTTVDPDKIVSLMSAESYLAFDVLETCMK